MFIVVWKGRGYIVALAAIVAVAIGALLIDATKLTPPWTGLVHTATQSLAGLAIWFLVRKFESEPGRVLISKKTGREFTVRRGAGSFFFIRTRHWAYILPALGAFVSIYAALTPSLRP